MNDPEIERILEAAYEAGAREAGYVMLRLPLEVRDLFREWLLEHHPDKLRHVLSLIRSTRDGKDYDAKWGERMTGRRPLCVDDRPALRNGGRAARVQQEAAQAAHGPVRAADGRAASCSERPATSGTCSSPATEEP